MIEAKLKSVFSEFAWKFLERNISVVPIAPGSKKPGQWSESDGWRGLSDWTRFAKRLPTDIEIDYWEKWPDAGVGVVLGKLSGIVALDKDYDLPGGGNDAMQALIPYSPVAKKGEKGWTRFYRYNGEKSCSFDVNGVRVLDVLSDGRQTVVPPTVHPTGLRYTWITEDTLDSIFVSELPILPDDFLQQVEKVLAPYQTDTDKKYQKRAVTPQKDDGYINTDMSIQTEYFRDLNRAALSRLEDWVIKIIPNATVERDGFRCIATWRNCKNPNVGIHQHGIRDWGGGYGMTPVDLVMYANGLTFQRAAELLRNCLVLTEPEPIKMTVCGIPPLPWANFVEPPPPVMLPPTTSTQPEYALPEFLSNPPGILGEIQRWITATAPKAQPELSLAAAIAIGSVVMGRTYVTQNGNMTSLYLVMVAKSTEGKEHPQSCAEKVLVEAGFEKLLGGSGYTSAGAVYSALNQSPVHLTTIDEMGKLLKLSRSKGNANSEAAIDKLVEAFGRLTGILRPPVYSTMTLTKDQREQQTSKVVYNPAITLLGATTPGTFYENLTSDLVKDGFLGRCIVVESKRPRQLTQWVSPTPPPKHIVDWCKSVHITGVKNGNLVEVTLPNQPAELIEMPMSEECRAEFGRIELGLNDAKDDAEKDGMDAVLGRTLEKSIRLSLIAAKSRDPNAKQVELADFQWAFKYVSHYDLRLVHSVRDQRTENAHDAAMKKLIEIIKNAKKYATDKKFEAATRDGFMPRGKLLGLMKGMNSKQVSELIETALEAGFIRKFEGPNMYPSIACDMYFVE